MISDKLTNIIFYFNVAFKPPATILKLQKTVNISGQSVEIVATVILLCSE